MASRLVRKKPAAQTLTLYNLWESNTEIEGGQKEGNPDLFSSSACHKFLYYRSQWPTAVSSGAAEEHPKAKVRGLHTLGGLPKYAEKLYLNEKGKPSTLPYRNKPLAS